MQDQDLDRAIHEEIHLAPHDTGWPSMFEAERQRLETALPGAFTEVAHIGSTAVPGLVAKPIIDLLAGVRSMEEADALVEAVCAAGYITSHEFNATLADRRWFMRAAHGRRTHHLHVVVHGGAEWQARLAFRDALRRDPALAGRYAALKQQLAVEYRLGREAYTDAKAGFIEQALAAMAAPQAPAAPVTVDPRLDTLCRLERELHQSDTRKDRTRLEALLHPNFKEIGRSGRTYSRAEILEHLADETPGPRILSTEFRLLDLAPGVCLLTYRSAHQTPEGATTRRTHRSSIWRQEAHGWQMVFHQGTPEDAG